MKKAGMLIFVTLIMVSLLTMSACNRTSESGSESAVITLTAASAASSANIMFQFTQETAEEVTDQSGGRLNIRLVWDGVLGGDSELIESCIDGSVPIIQLGSSPLLSYIPEIAIFDMPFVFESKDQAYAGIAQFVDFFDEVFQRRNLKILGMGFAGFRGFSSNVNIRTPADFNGLRIRTLENRFHMAFWNNLGASPTPLAFPELYLALSQGLMHAQDNPITAVQASRFYEVQDYFMSITAFPFVSFWLMNLDAYNTLSAGDRALVEDFAQRNLRESFEQSDRNEADAFRAIGNEITVLPITNEIMAAMRTAAEPVWGMIAQSIGSDITQAYLNTAR